MLNSNNHKNHLLAALSEEEYKHVSSKLEKVFLKLGTIVQRPEQEIEHIFFPTTCMISLLATLEGGDSVETGVVGNEGVVGIPVVLGVGIGASEGLVQIEGEAMRMKAGALGSLMNGGQLQRILLRYTHTIFTQVAQTAACNRAHNLNQRLARWLLLTHDRVGQDKFELTHEFLARMLGTRRAGVSVAASTLRDAGVIDYTRGHVTIVDRQGLENASCECYRIVKAEFDRLFK